MNTTKNTLSKSKNVNCIFTGIIVIAVVGIVYLSLFANKKVILAEEPQTSSLRKNAAPSPPAFKKGPGIDKNKEEPQAEMPLTDIAPLPPVVDVSAEEHPLERLRKKNLVLPPQYTKPVKLPNNMDIRKPPRWNETLASPAVPTEAPDPFTPPPIAVNPERVPQEDVPRLTIGD